MAEKREKGRRVRNTLKFLMFGLLCCFLFSLFYVHFFVSAATPPSIFTYQGKLLVGGSLATTTQSMYFILYSASTGGTVLYTASGTLGSPLPVNIYPSGGLFSIDLGNGTTNALSPAIFRDNSSVYLEVRVGSDTLTPRKRISATPYAFNAKYLDGIGAATLSGSTYIPVSDNSGNFEFNRITSTGIVAGTSTFDAITLGGVTRSSWPTGGGSGTFVGLTSTSTYNGSITYSTYRGYQAANRLCNIAYSGSHFCRTDEIVNTIAAADISALFTTGATGWIAEGPPGYTSNSNDCNGYTASSTGSLGAFWLYDTDGGGAGWLTNCSVQKAISCCQ